MLYSDKENEIFVKKSKNVSYKDIHYSFFPFIYN